MLPDGHESNVVYNISCIAQTTSYPPSYPTIPNSQIMQHPPLSSQIKVDNIVAMLTNCSRESESSRIDNLFTPIIIKGVYINIKWVAAYQSEKSPAQDKSLPFCYPSVIFHLTEWHSFFPYLSASTDLNAKFDFWDLNSDRKLYCAHTAVLY